MDPELRNLLKRFEERQLEKMRKAGLHWIWFQFGPFFSKNYINVTEGEFISNVSIRGEKITEISGERLEFFCLNMEEIDKKISEKIAEETKMNNDVKKLESNCKKKLRDLLKIGIFI